MVLYISVHIPVGMSNKNVTPKFAGHIFFHLEPAYLSPYPALSKSGLSLIFPPLFTRLTACCLNALSRQF